MLPVITHSDDYYAMYLPLYLIQNNKKDIIVLNGRQVLGDVIFLPDSNQLKIDFQAYT